ncbi:hypothetical protein LPJ79_005402 [Coemansia sp. RSA 1821]|nr:hypothetical protein LPJ68_005231 [Coemansia sp. RSA 1086]KAJ1747217.1 hypothetical protein LPJ79_005402 [Coemansia sp. RSA 1821]
MIIASPLQSSSVPVGDIPSFIFSVAEQYKDEVILVDAATQKRFTISDILTTSTKLAAGLARNGYGGKVISVFDNTDVRCVIVYYAALMTGGTYQSLCTEMGSENLRDCIDHSGTPIIFTTKAYISQLQTAIEKMNVKVFVFDSVPQNGTFQNEAGFSQLLIDDPSFSPVRITSVDDAMAKPAYLAYASGMQQTLRPLMLSHFGLLSSYAIGCATAGSLSKTAVSAVPFANSHGIGNIAHLPLLSGSCVVQASNYNGVSCLELLEEWQAEIFLATYSVLAEILSEAKRSSDGMIVVGTRQFDVSKLQVIFMHELRRGAYAFKEKVAALFDVRIVELYGYMETGLIAGIITEHPRIDGSVGLLCPNVRARIVLDGNELEDGQYGEILVSTPRITAADKKTPPYFHTGDFGTVTRDGVVIIKSRMSELLRLKNGTIASPTDIEEQLLHSAWVEDCAVVSSHNANSHDVPFAYMVLADNAPNVDTILKPFEEQFPGISGQSIEHIPRSPKGDPVIPCCLR